MSKSPTTVQQWVDTLPPHPGRSMYAANTSKTHKRFLPRDISLQSDDSYCSSLESVLELRKPDPEAVLYGLGFGPPKSANVVSKIPQRFLQPSKILPQIGLDKFLEQYYGEPVKPEHSNPTSPSPTRVRPKTC